MWITLNSDKNKTENLLFLGSQYTSENHLTSNINFKYNYLSIILNISEKLTVSSFQFIYIMYNKIK